MGRVSREISSRLPLVREERDRPEAISRQLKAPCRGVGTRRSTKLIHQYPSRDTASVEATLPCWVEGICHHLSCESIAHMYLGIRRKRQLLEGCTAPKPAWSHWDRGFATSECPKPITAECCTCLPVCHFCRRVGGQGNTTLHARCGGGVCVCGGERSGGGRGV